MKVHLLLGAPGSGKGSQAKLFEEKFGLTHISTGDILRDSVSKGTEIGLLAKANMASGKLVDDDTVNGIAFARLQDESKNVFFDGYPRTLNQAMALDGFLSNKGFQLGLVAYIDVPMSVLESRIVHRRICSNSMCGAIYHLEQKKPIVDGVCDRCNSPIELRFDDSSQAFKARMKVFNTFYEPMLDYYRKRPNFRQVGGLATPDEVFKAISKYYEEFV